MTDLQKTQATVAIVKMLEAVSYSANTSWEDYASGLSALGADRPSLEAMRRTGRIVSSAEGSFRLSK